MREPFRQEAETALRVSRVTIAGNILLSLYKFFTGITSHSGAMLSDAVHSASDVFSTLIVIIGVKAAEKAADEEHPYGHERMECVAALLLSAVLFLTGAAIGLTGIRAVFLKEASSLPMPGRPALLAAVVSIAVKEGMYRYTKRAAKKTGSGALLADAWHHRSDALSSVGSFAGILGARMGLAVLDPVAGLVICIFILKAAAGIFTDSIDRMVDRACDTATAEAMRKTALAQPGVLGVDRMDTRIFGDRIYVEVEICIDGTATLFRSHEIAERVHDSVEAGFPKVKHCMVHMNPSGREGSRESLRSSEHFMKDPH